MSSSFRLLRAAEGSELCTLKSGYILISSYSDPELLAEYAAAGIVRMRSLGFLN